MGSVGSCPTSEQNISTSEGFTARPHCVRVHLLSLAYNRILSIYDGFVNTQKTVAFHELRGGALAI